MFLMTLEEYPETVIRIFFWAALDAFVVMAAINHQPFIIIISILI